jgi:hypothetical protein
VGVKAFLVFQCVLEKLQSSVTFLVLFIHNIFPPNSRIHFQNSDMYTPGSRDVMACGSQVPLSRSSRHLIIQEIASHLVMSLWRKGVKSDVMWRPDSLAAIFQPVPELGAWVKISVPCCTEWFCGLIEILYVQYHKVKLQVGVCVCVCVWQHYQHQYVHSLWLVVFRV